MFIELTKKIRETIFTRFTLVKQKKHARVPALSLVETLISLTILSVLFLMMMQSFNAILFGSYLIDARTSVRTEGEFVSQFFELYARNADPRTIVALNTATNVNICNNAPISGVGMKPSSITWQPLGSGETYTFYFETSPTGKGRLSFDQKVPGVATPIKSVLTYGDVNIKDVVMTCESATDSLSGQTLTTVSVQFKLDSALQLGGRPAVQDVQRYVTVVVR